MPRNEYSLMIDYRPFVVTAGNLSTLWLCVTYFMCVQKVRHRMDVRRLGMCRSQARCLSP